MIKQIVLLLALISLTNAALNMTSVCMALAKPNEYHQLTGNVTTATNCFDIVRSNITLDCAGFSINASANTRGSYGIRDLGQNNITIKNCVVYGFSAGVYVGSQSNNTYIYNMNVSRQQQTQTASAANVYGLRIENARNISIINITSDGNNASTTLDTNAAYGFYFLNVINATVINTRTLNSTALSGTSIYSYYLQNTNNSKFVNGMANTYNKVYLTTSSNNTFDNFTLYQDPKIATVVYAIIVTARSMGNIFNAFNMSPSNMLFLRDEIQSNNTVVSNSMHVQNGFAGGSSTSFMLIQQVQNITLRNNTFINFSERFQNYVLDVDNVTFAYNYFAGAYGANNLQSMIVLDPSQANRWSTFIGNTFVNNSLFGGSIIFDGFSNNSNFSNNVIMNGKNIIYRFSGYNITVDDDILINQSATTIASVGEYENTQIVFTNISTLAPRNLSFPTNGYMSNATVRWYLGLDVRKEDDSIPQGYVNITNQTNSSPMISFATNYPGTPVYNLITEFVGNRTVNVTYTPHNITVYPNSQYPFLNNTLLWTVNSTALLTLYVDYLNYCRNVTSAGYTVPGKFVISQTQQYVYCFIANESNALLDCGYNYVLSSPSSLNPTKYYLSRNNENSTIKGCITDNFPSSVNFQNSSGLIENNIILNSKNDTISFEFPTFTFSKELIEILLENSKNVIARNNTLTNISVTGLGIIENSTNITIANNRFNNFSNLTVSNALNNLAGLLYIGSNATTSGGFRYNMSDVTVSNNYFNYGIENQQSDTGGTLIRPLIGFRTSNGFLVKLDFYNNIFESHHSRKLNVSIEYPFSSGNAILNFNNDDFSKYEGSITLFRRNLNVTFNNVSKLNKTAIYGNSGYLAVKYYSNFQVLNYSNSPVSGALVNVTNTSSTSEMYSSLSDLSGYTAVDLFTEFIANNSFVYDPVNFLNADNITYFTPHNVSVAKVNYTTNNTYIIANESSIFVVYLNASGTTKKKHEKKFITASFNFDQQECNYPFPFNLLFCLNG